MGFFSRGDDDGAKTLVYTGGSSTILSFVESAKRRKRVIAIASVVIVVVAAIVGFGVMRYIKADAAARVVDGYSALTRCLLGELPKGEATPSMRFRAMQLSALTQVEVKRTPGKGEPWPDRCARYAHMLSEGVKRSLSEEKGKKLAASAKELGDQLSKKDGYHQDISEVVDKVFAQAKTAGIILNPKPDLAAPPALAKTLTIDGLKRESRVTDKPLELGRIHVQPHSSGSIHFIIDDSKIEGAPMLCSFDDSSGKCNSLAAAIVRASKAGFRLLGTAADGASPLVFAGGTGVDGFFRSTGDKLGAGRALGGFVAADGFAAVLSGKGDRLELLKSSGKKTSKGSASPGGGLDLAEPLRDAQLLWNHLVFLGTKSDVLTLASARVEAGGRGVGRAVAIGELPGVKLPDNRAGATKSRLSGCQTGTTTVLRARVGNSAFLSFWLGNRWSKPVKLSSAGGSLSCNGSVATVTRRDVGAGDSVLSSSVTHHRCTPTECKSKSQPLRDILEGEQSLAPEALVHIAGLDGKLLMVWQAAQRGGIRMRLAEAARIAKAEDVILFDDLISGGAVTQKGTVLDMRLLPAGNFAVLLLSTAKGIHVLRIGADGKVGPIDIER